MLRATTFPVLYYPGVLRDRRFMSQVLKYAARTLSY